MPEISPSYKGYFLYGCIYRRRRRTSIRPRQSCTVDVRQNQKTIDALRTCPAAAAAGGAFSTSGTSQLPRGFLPMGSARRSTALVKMQSGSGSSMASRRQHGHATKTRHSDLGIGTDDHHESSVAKFNRHLSEMLSDLQFHKEGDKIKGYRRKIYDNFPESILYRSGKRLSLLLFVITGDAVKLASEVMEMSGFKHKFSTISFDEDAYEETVKPTLEVAVRRTISFVILNSFLRKKALDQVTGQHQGPR